MQVRIWSVGMDDVYLVADFLVCTHHFSATFLREELAIRLSHRVRDLQELPDGLSEMENVKLVQGWYAESFEELVK